MPHTAAGHSRVDVELRDDLVARLRADATRERRSLRAQAALVIENALGVTPVAPAQRATPAPSPPAADFSAWYQAYPLHKARADAEKAYNAAIRAGSEPAELLAGIDRYRQELRATGVNVKYPAGWLRGKCWLDEPAPPPALFTRPSTTDAKIAAAQAMKTGRRPAPVQLEITRGS